MKTISDKDLKDILVEPAKLEKPEKLTPDPVTMHLRGIRSELIAIRDRLDQPAEKEPDMTAKFDQIIKLLEDMCAKEMPEPPASAPSPADYNFEIVRDNDGNIKTVKARIVT